MSVNKEESKIKKLAIIGGGPRGLAALESIYSFLAAKTKLLALHTQLFEAGELPGAGHVYNLEQPDTNWLNFSERALRLDGRNAINHEDLSIPSFPSFHHWSGYNSEEDTGLLPDKFPLRSTLGIYLNERYNSIASVLLDNGLLEVIKAEIVETDWDNDTFKIIDNVGNVYHSDELVLTIGHQPTEHSKQLKDWIEYSASNATVDVLTEPYPVESILESIKMDSNKVVALRGFGLAMVDIMRALTIGLGGKFKVIDEPTQKMTYTKSGREPLAIIPFSLDGLPMAPKPLNLKIDQWFLPTEAEKKTFGNVIRVIAKEGNATSIEFLGDAIAPMVARIFKALKGKAETFTIEEDDLAAVIMAWLMDGDFEHRLIVSKSNPPQNMLEQFIGMATGTNSISLDFCIGQVWRHCQPVMYQAISFSNLDDEIIANVISLDERLKRYSYGPPVKSLQQVLALIEAEVLSLDFVRNPTIKMTKKGWKLSNQKDEILVNLMVNSVLDPAKILEMNSPIVRNLLQKSMVEPVHDELGIKTKKNGCVQLSKNRDEIPLAVMGRLSKGTIVGVDAVLQCFEDRADFWAEGVINRI